VKLVYRQATRLVVIVGGQGLFLKRVILIGATVVVFLVVSRLAAAAPAAEGGGPEVSFASLLEMMVDREALARFPAPSLRLRDQSSYNRLSTTPDDPETWFANQDFGNFIRVEETAGRKEWVLLDHAKPGVLVRSWMADRRLTPAPKKDQVRTILRIYLDGAAEPVVEGHVHDLFNGTLLAPYPFGHRSLSSAVSFLPIPYARSCKITTDEPPLYYIFDYREYPEGTPVKTFSKEDLRSARGLLERIGKKLSDPPDVSAAQRVTLNRKLNTQEEASLVLPGGGAAVRTLSL
jgi:hypothetical protein